MPRGDAPTGHARLVECHREPGAGTGNGLARRFEHYFRELAEIHASRGFREPRLVADLQDRYGVTASADWIPPLKARHELKLLGE